MLNNDSYYFSYDFLNDENMLRFYENMILTGAWYTFCSITISFCISVTKGRIIIAVYFDAVGYTSFSKVTIDHVATFLLKHTTSALS